MQRKLFAIAALLVCSVMATVSLADEPSEAETPESGQPSTPAPEPLPYPDIKTGKDDDDSKKKKKKVRIPDLPDNTPRPAYPGGDSSAGGGIVGSQPGSSGGSGPSPSFDVKIEGKSPVRFPDITK